MKENNKILNNEKHVNYIKIDQDHKKKKEDTPAVINTIIKKLMQKQESSG